MKTKVCSKCKKIKKISDFHRNRTRKTGLYHACKECRNKRDRISWHKNREIHSQKRKKYIRKQVLKNHNITETNFLLMLKKQNNKCVICGLEMERAYIDHCHKTLKIRGLLCNGCNLGLGIFHDNIETLKNAIKYLSNP